MPKKTRRGGRKQREKLLKRLALQRAQIQEGGFHPNKPRIRRDVTGYFVNLDYALYLARQKYRWRAVAKPNVIDAAVSPPPLAIIKVTDVKNKSNSGNNIIEYVDLTTIPECAELTQIEAREDISEQETVILNQEKPTEIVPELHSEQVQNESIIDFYTDTIDLSDIFDPTEPFSVTTLSSDRSEPTRDTNLENLYDELDDLVNLCNNGEVEERDTQGITIVTLTD